MSSVNRVNPSSYLYPVGRTAAHAHVTAARSRVSPRICSISILSGDILAFVLAAFLAFAIDIAPQFSPYARAVENLRTVGMAWHGWGTLLVLVSLLSYFGGRGHYTSRVPSLGPRPSTWRRRPRSTLSCDVFLTVAIYERPLLPEGVLRWVLLCPCLMLSRAAIRQVLRATGLWSLRTLIMAPPGEIEATRARRWLLLDAALGYSVVGTIASGLSRRAENGRRIVGPVGRTRRRVRRRRRWRP